MSYNDLNHNIRDVDAFHRKFGIDKFYVKRFTMLPNDLFEFRIGFINEEIEELSASNYDGNIYEIADALIDIAYVVYGTVLIMGAQSAHNYFPSFKKHPQNRYNRIKLEHRWHSVNFYKERMTMSSDLLNEKHYSGNWMGCVHTSLSIAYTCMELASKLRLPWQALWDEVHLANMRKVKATREFHSKRMFDFDVVKPAGWVGPDLQSVIDECVAIEKGEDDEANNNI